MEALPDCNAPAGPHDNRILRDERLKTVVWVHGSLPARFMVESYSSFSKPLAFSMGMMSVQVMVSNSDVFVADGENLSYF
jgi:uncharacterized protein YfaP (DUF2135 family)